MAAILLQELLATSLAGVARSRQTVCGCRDSKVTYFSSVQQDGTSTTLSYRFAMLHSKDSQKTGARGRQWSRGVERELGLVRGSINGQVP